MEQRNHIKSLLSMILGILGLLLTCACIGIIPCIISLVLSIKCFKDVHENRKMATTGLITSIMGIMLFIILLVAVGSTNEEQLTDAHSSIEENIEATDSISNIEENITKTTSGDVTIPSSTAIAESSVDVSNKVSSKQADEQPPLAPEVSITYDVEVHFLDVGQGLSILVKSSDDVLIYDGGSRDASSFVIAYLQEQGIDNIDYLISSHYDEDHMSGLIGCLNVFTVENVIGPDYTHDSELYSSFLQKITNQNLEMQHPTVGTEFEIGSATFTILSPSTIDESESNNNSMAIKLVNGNNVFIFTGDAEFECEQSMISSGIDLDSDVLCVGHHGSANSTSKEFLENTSPDYCIISCGINNKYYHPNAEIMERLQTLSVDLFRTDKQGTIIATSDGDIITWNTEPSNDFSSGVIFDETNSVPSESEVQAPLENDITYVLNTNSKKFHYPTCRGVKDMSLKNRHDSAQTREEIISQGYKPCGICHP